MLLTMPLSAFSNRLHPANQAGVYRCSIQRLPERNAQIPDARIGVRLTKLLLGYGVVNLHCFLR